VNRISRRSLAGCLFSLALAACAGPRLAPELKPEDGSRPNATSIYFYLTASLMRAQDSYQSAHVLYQKALDADPNSHGIQRQILLNALSLTQEADIAGADVKGLIKRYAGDLAADSELLFALYDFYDELEDEAGLQRVLKLLDQHHPGALTSIQHFVYASKYQNRQELRYLETALKQAQDRPDDLLLLSRLFYFFDPAQRLRALQRYHELRPSAESHQLLADALVEAADSVAVNSYLASLDYPEQREQFSYFAQTALQSNQPRMLLPQAANWLASRDLDLMGYLGLAALLENQTGLLRQLSVELAGLNAPEYEKQALRALLIAASLLNGETHSLTGQLNLLSETRYFADIFHYYDYARHYARNDAETDSTAEDYAGFLDQVRTRIALPAAAAYISELAIAEAESSSPALLESRYQLILWLRERTLLSVADYSFLSGYYHDQGRTGAKHDILREALAHYPEQTDFCNDLGYSLLLEGGDLEEARALIERALLLEPQNPYFLDSLGWYHYLKGDYDRALEILAPLADMQDLPAEIAWHLGAVHLKLDNGEQAKKFLQLSIEIGGDPDSVSLAEEALRRLP